MKTCLTSVVIREMPIKTKEIPLHTHLDWLKLKRLIIPNFGRDVKNMHYHTLLMEMWSGKTSMENSWQFLKKLKHTATRWSNQSYPRYLPKRNKNKCLHKDLYLNDHRRFIIIQNWKQMSIKRWMDKQIMIYPYNGILFSN